MNVTLTPLADIHPAPWNVRTGHDVDGIAESIRINGFRDPIEVWRETGEIVAGEGRYHAAKALALAEVPVIYHDFGGLAEAKRYGIANNRLGDKSEWDLPALESQLEELDSLAGTGFGEDDLPDPDDWGSAASSLPDEDRAPFQQMTFTLHDEQAEVVKEAMERAKADGDFDGSPNENSNGNALWRICEAYLGVPA